jgi:hypothetical protein
MNGAGLQIMMQETQENLLELSRQGDPEAIAALISRSLQPKGIRTEAEIDEDCLHLFLESNSVPAQAQLVPFIRNGMTSLGAESIRTVRIYGRQKGQRQAIWQETVDLDLPHAFSVATVQQRLSTLRQRPAQVSFGDDSLDGLALEQSNGTVNGTVLEDDLPLGGVVNGRNGATLVQPASQGGSDANGGSGGGRQIEIANKVMHLTDYGGVIDTAPTGIPRLKLRQPPTPHRDCPPFPELLGRQVEIESAIAALQSATSVEFYGEVGLGKTALLRAIAYVPALSSAFTDGIVYHHAYRQTVPDLLQLLLMDFYDYERSIPVKATETEIREALQDKKALILLDDVLMSREEVENLLSISPHLTFLLAGTECHVWGEERAIPLPGLPLDDALTLLERGLGRPIEPKEHDPAAAICNLLGGHPLRILQVVSLVRPAMQDVNQPLDQQPLEAIAQQLQDSPSPEALVLKASAALPQAERQALAALIVLGGVPARPENLAPVTGLHDVEHTLRSLCRRGLALTDGNRYSIAQNLLPPLQRIPKRDQWINRLLGYFTTWAEQHGQVSELAQESNVLLRMMQLGVETERWSEVLRLARAIDPALALSGRWGAWEQSLQWALQAAQALGDRPAEAWAMHQLGTRSLSLDDPFAAQSWLTRALELRESADDHPGTVATLHNLGLLLPPVTQVEPPAAESPPAPTPTPVPTPTPLPTIRSTATPAPPWLKWAILAGLFAALGTLLALLFTSNRNPPFWLSRDRLDFENQERHTRSEVETVELENRNSEPIEISRIAPTGGAAEDFEVAENCTTVPIQPTAGCTVEVSFVPTERGNRRADLTFFDAQGDRLQSIPLRGSGEAASPTLINFTPSRLNFAEQDVGIPTRMQEITLENVGTVPITFERIELAGAGQGDFQATENCTGLAIQPEVRCTIEVVFAPTAVGDRAASLVIQSNASDRPWVLPLRGFGNESAAAGAPGQGGSVASLGVNPDSLDFGELRVAAPNVAPQRVTETITLNNSGAAPIVMQELSLGGQHVSDFQSSTTCTNNTVAPNSSCVVEITFAPGAAGERVADLLIASNAQNGIVRVRLSGTGVNAIPRVPRIRLTPDELTFDAQETDPSGKVVTITNDGAIDLQIGNVAIAGNDPNYFVLAARDNSINCANSVLAPGERCDVAIAFRGSGSDRTAQLTVSSNATNRIPGVRLVGRGTGANTGTGSGNTGGNPGSGNAGGGNTGGGTPQTPRISVSQANLTFNTANRREVISVTNNGTANLQIGNIAFAGNDPGFFSSAEGTGLISCANTVLAPGARCDISLTFVGSERNRSAQLTIPSNASERPIAVNLIGIGTSSGETPGATPGATPGGSALSISSQALNFGTQPLLITAQEQVLTLTNTGSSPLEIGEIAFSGDPDFFAFSNSGGNVLDCSYQPLDPGGSCQLTLGFTPFQEGDRTAQLTIPSSTSTNPISVNLSGFGEPSGTTNSVPSYSPYGR